MKTKTYTEEEIFKIIDEWQHHKKYGDLNKQVSDEILNNLKQRFMTPQGFVRALDKAGLRGKKF